MYRKEKTDRTRVAQRLACVLQDTYIDVDMLAQRVGVTLPTLQQMTVARRRIPEWCWRRMAQALEEIDFQPIHERTVWFNDDGLKRLAELKEILRGRHTKKVTSNAAVHLALVLALRYVNR